MEFVSAVLITLGVLVVLVVVVDTTLTTMSLRGGAGPLTSRLAETVWRAMCRLAGPGPGRHRLLGWAGTVVLLITFLTWVAGLWVGWFLVFSAEPESVLDQYGRPADGWSRLYYSGFSIFTLGVGDYTPGTTSAQVSTSLAVLTGLFLVTLGITYLLQVVSAVVDKRTVAGHIAALGDDPVDIVRRGWTPDGFSPMFTQHLTSLTPEVIRLGERHVAFPVLHYFHAHHRAEAAPVAMTVLDGAVLLLRHGVRPADRPDVGAVDPLARALRQLVRTLEGSFIPVPDVPLNPPSLDAVARSGVPVVDPQTYEQSVEDCRGQRCGLRGWCASDGWTEQDLSLAAD
ncbi:potassium channel family protein [Micromonospora siamensis]|uniref:potassium channel family protein n=1 Tax=Micromonospora siamensis TaxID=299152 RepID=UPI0012FE09CC|nr:potassium channel family protein [Micromonospora siamensis]